MFLRIIYLCTLVLYCAVLASAAVTKKPLEAKQKVEENVVIAVNQASFNSDGPSEFCSGEIKTGFSGDTYIDVQRSLSIHKTHYCSKHGGELFECNHLSWDVELAETAQKCADRCIHSNLLPSNECDLASDGTSVLTYKGPAVEYPYQVVHVWANETILQPPVLSPERFFQWVGCGRVLSERSKKGYLVCLFKASS